MTAGRHEQSRATDVFTYGGQGAILIASLSAALLLLLIAAATTSPGFQGSFADVAGLTIGVAFLSVLCALPLWLRAKAPTILRIGPEGLQLALTWSAPLPWGQVRRIVTDRRGGPLTSRLVLRLDLVDGVLPPFRFAVWRRLELWHIRRFGLVIPISSLDRDPKTVIASIRRFAEVTGQEE